METSKKEKAIAQAQANLAIDRIYLNPTFVENYCRRNNIIPSNSGPRLVLRPNKNNKNNQK